MNNQEKTITVSVRLSVSEYNALHMAAQEQYTSMSGMLKKLLHGYLKGE